ncbi:KAP family NTPase [Enterobacter hormaechei]|uniref:KAP family NTPase n=1 Tax=Enterobacter hormaechei TaxID=158836 RepID=UPI001A16EF80|nr:KAP family NTPase [Enterobacter hormaechei]ELS4524225.1 KAP family NTPase [Enterobacter hormaechei]MDK2993697.1 KAP family NTPase [Enterobacter hormaechei]
METTFDTRDEYQRRAIAEKLETLLDSNLDISPLVIDGYWGTGKTEFSLKLCNLLSKNTEERIVIYIDAFKEDHCEDPLLSITAAIANVLPEKEKRELIKKAVPAIKFGVKTALKAGAGWILRQNTDGLTEEFQQAIKDTSNAAIDGTIENLISEHMESESNIKALNNKLRELSTNKKIILIIDELDRCRPTFAVELLEKIKHIFDAPNVNFILVANLSQLKAAINHVYGSSVDSQNYLDKFIKYIVRLPDTFKPDGFQAFHTSHTHWDILVEKSTLTQPIRMALSERIEEVINARQLSLREIECLHRYLEVYQLFSKNSISDKNIYVYNLTRFLAVYTYCFGDKSKLRNANSTETLNEIARVLNIDNIALKDETRYSTPHYLVIFYGLIRTNKQLTTKYINPDDGSLEILNDLCERMSRSDFSDFSYNKTFQVAYDKLSLAF